MTERQRIFLQTAAARDRAEALLRELLEARDISERNLAELKTGDHLKTVTGRSSLDNAIDATRRMCETLERQVDTLRRNLSDDDLRAISRPAGG
jgi:hypothetical protein